MAAVEDKKRREEALERQRAADPPLCLSSSPKLSQHAHAAASHLFSALLPFFPKSPVDRLLADEGFDAEQIWYQIDLLSRPLLSTMRREVRRLEREPPKVLLPAQGKAEVVKKGEDGEEGEQEDDDDGMKMRRKRTWRWRRRRTRREKKKGKGRGRGWRIVFSRLRSWRNIWRRMRKRSMANR